MRLFVQAIKETFVLLSAFTQPLITGLLGLGLVVGLVSATAPQREVVMPNVFERQALQGMQEDDPLWRCKQMGNRQCYPGEVVP